MKLSNKELIEVLKSEQKMEEYVKYCNGSPHEMDPIIWRIHFSVPTHKRMAILNEVFNFFFTNMKIQYCFLPPNMILAKVYKSMKIPFKILSGDKLQISKNIGATKFSKDDRVNKYKRYYNSLPRKTIPATPGIYDFEDDIPNKHVSYKLFRKMLILARNIANKTRENAPADSLNKSNDVTPVHVVKPLLNADRYRNLKENSFLNKNTSPAKRNMLNAKDMFPPASNIETATPASQSTNTEKIIQVCEPCAEENQTPERAKISNTNRNSIDRTEPISSTITYLDTSKLEKLTSSSKASTISEISTMSIDDARPLVISLRKSDNSVDSHICLGKTCENAISNTKDSFVDESRTNENSAATLIFSPSKKRQNETPIYSNTCKHNSETNETNSSKMTDFAIEVNRKEPVCELTAFEKPEARSRTMCEFEENEINSKHEFQSDNSSVNKSNYTSGKSQASTLEDPVFSKYENCSVVISSSERQIEPVTSSEDNIAEKSNSGATEMTIIDNFVEKDFEISEKKVFTETNGENELINKFSKSPPKLSLAVVQPNTETEFEFAEDGSPKRNRDLELNTRFSKFSEEVSDVTEGMNDIFELNEDSSQSIELDFGIGEDFQIPFRQETDVDVGDTYSSSPLYFDLKQSLPEETLTESANPQTEDIILAYDTNSESSNCIIISNDKIEPTIIRGSDSSVTSSAVSKSRASLREKNSSDSEPVEAVLDFDFEHSESRVLIPEKAEDNVPRKSQLCASTSVIENPMKRKLYMPVDDNDSFKSSWSKSSARKGSKAIPELPALRTRKWVLQNFGIESSSPSSSDIFMERLRPRICDNQKKRRLKSHKVSAKKKTERLIKKVQTAKLTQYKHHKILKDSSRFNKIDETNLRHLYEDEEGKNERNESPKGYLSNSNRKKDTFSQIINKTIDDDGFSDSFSSSSVLTNELQRLSLNRNQSSTFAESDHETGLIAHERPRELNGKLNVDNNENNYASEEETDFENINLDYVEEVLKRIPRRKEDGSKKKLDFRSFGSQKKQKFVQPLDSDISEEGIFQDSQHYRSLQKNLKKSIKKRDTIRSMFLRSTKPKGSQNQSLKNVSRPSKESRAMSPLMKQEKTPDMSKSVLLTDDDDEYGSEELTFELNTNLNKWNNEKDEREPNEENESVSSRTFDADINQLLTEYAALNSEQKIASTITANNHEENSPRNVTNQINVNESSSGSKRFNFNDIMWDSYPDNMETAMSTPEEKLEQVRGDLKKLLTESGNTQLLAQLGRRESSKDSDTDLTNFSDW